MEPQRAAPLGGTAIAAGQRRASTTSTSSSRRIRKREKSSRFRGVSFISRARKWKAVLTVGPTQKHKHFLGYYKDEEAAARAYDEASLRLRGSTSRLNFPRDNDSSTTSRSSSIESHRENRRPRQVTATRHQHPPPVAAAAATAATTNRLHHPLLPASPPPPLPAVAVAATTTTTPARVPLTPTASGAADDAFLDNFINLLAQSETQTEEPAFPPLEIEEGNRDIAQMQFLST